MESRGRGISQVINRKKHSSSKSLRYELSFMKRLLKKKKAHDPGRESNWPQKDLNMNAETSGSLEVSKVYVLFSVDDIKVQGDWHAFCLCTEF